MRRCVRVRSAVLAVLLAGGCLADDVDDGALMVSCDVYDQGPCVVRIDEVGSDELQALGGIDQRTLGSEDSVELTAGICSSGAGRGGVTWSFCAVTVDGRTAVIGDESEGVVWARTTIDDEVFDFPLDNRHGEATLLPGRAGTLHLVVDDEEFGLVTGPF